MLDLIGIARGHGVGRVEVTANQHALAFYEKAGFAAHHEVTADDVAYGRALMVMMRLTSAATSCGLNSAATS